MKEQNQINIVNTYQELLSYKNSPIGGVYKVLNDESVSKTNTIYILAGDGTIVSTGSSGSGGGGTIDPTPTQNSTNAVSSGGTYNSLQNKVDTTRTINNIPLTSNITLVKANISDLTNVDNTSDINKPISTAQATALAAKQNTLTFDSIPTSGSTNPITSGGVFTSLSGLVISVPKFKGILIPQFKTVSKFDNLGSTLASPQLVIASGGIGLVTATSGTAAIGYLKLNNEIQGRNSTRLDYLLNWSMSDTTASKTLGIGDSGNGYFITVANSSGNLIITFPSGATVSAAMTGTFNIWLSFNIANQSITTSMGINNVISLGLTATNPFNVPIFEVNKVVKPKLSHAIFNTNSTICTIIGFLYNSENWNGDPSLNTSTVALNSAGVPGEHDNMIIIPYRSSLSTPLKVVHFFHGRTLTFKSIIDVTTTDNGKTGQVLLNAGYALIATSGGISNTTAETDWWGNPWGTSKAAQVYDSLNSNSYNTGNEYLIGWSMGGTGSANYAREFSQRVKAIWDSCPVLDLEENVNTLSIQQSTALKQSLDLAYCQWYYNISGATQTTDPQTDLVNYRQVSDPGGQPISAMRNVSITTVSTAVTTANTTIALTSGAKIFTGDYILFKWSGQYRQVIGSALGLPNSVTLDVAITAAASEQVSIFRPYANVGYDFAWNNRSLASWASGSSTTANSFTKRNTAHPELDVRPFNPTKFVDVFAEAGIKFRIMVGGNAGGGSTDNDGILNNAPMYTFRDSINAIVANSASILVGSGGHLTATTLSASDTLSFFNSN